MCLTKTLPVQVFRPAPEKEVLISYVHTAVKDTFWISHSYFGENQKKMRNGNRGKGEKKKTR
jgi:hypothetical protein